MNRIDIFYQIKPLIPRRVQIFLRQKMAAAKLKANKETWPIDPRADIRPAVWRVPAGQYLWAIGYERFCLRS